VLCRVSSSRPHLLGEAAMRNLPPIFGFHIRAALKALPILAALAVAAVPVAARSDETAITGLRIVSEASDNLVIDVQYRYSGEQGSKVFASVVMGNGGEASPNFAYRPGSVKPGRGWSRVALSLNQSAPDVFTSDALIATLYVGGQEEFAKQIFRFPKTWAQAGHVLRPAKPWRTAKVGGMTGEVVQTPAQTPAQGEVQRQVLPDGTVQLQRADGTIVQRTKGGETIIRPDGTKSSTSYLGAQPPTPPSGAPGTVLSDWLEFEAEQLLYIMRTLTGNDTDSINNYLQREGSGASPYAQIRSRTDVISLMTRPMPGS
jgi:hypothetical protein